MINPARWGLPKINLRKWENNKVISLLWITGLLLFVLALSFSRLVRADLGHDEDQFIASARLFLDHALLPYIDYPYFHTPYLIFLYALIFRFFNHNNLFAARLLSLLFGTGTVFLVFGMVMVFSRDLSIRTRLLTASGIVLLYISNPLFIATSNRSWNHDASLFFALLALCMCLLASGNQRSLIWLFCAGLMLGIAVGTRASYVTVIPAYVIGLLFMPNNKRIDNYLKSIGVFFSGFILAMLPIIYMFSISPEKFIFGNLGYARLNTLYRFDVPAYGPMSLPQKVDYLFSNIVSQPGNMLVTIAFLYFGVVVGVYHLMQKDQERYQTILHFIYFPFLLVGVFLPTPSWYQYFYTLVPFALLFASSGLSYLMKISGESSPWFLRLLITFSLLSSLFVFNDFRRMSFLFHPHTWRPNLTHNIGEDIAEAIAIKNGSKQSRVLSLSPVYPLEGGLEIYPEFATGVFAWRSAPYLDEDERKQFGMVDEDNLEGYLEMSPPEAILVGFQPDLEESFIEYARQNGYTSQEVSPSMTLWIR